VSTTGGVFGFGFGALVVDFFSMTCVSDEQFPILRRFSVGWDLVCSCSSSSSQSNSFQK